MAMAILTQFFHTHWPALKSAGNSGKVSDKDLLQEQWADTLLTAASRFQCRLTGKGPCLPSFTACHGAHSNAHVAVHLGMQIFCWIASVDATMAYILHLPPSPSPPNATIPVPPLQL